MGGPGNDTVSTQQGITQQQLGLAESAQKQSAQQTALGNQTIQPVINYETALATGSPQTAMAASAPALTNIARSKEANKESIYDSTTPGAARDVELAQNAQNANNTTASTLTQSWLSAFPALSSLSSGLESFGLSGLGASSSAFGGASSSNQSVATMQAAQSPWNFIGELAGAGGQAAGGTNFASLGKGAAAA